MPPIMGGIAFDLAVAFYFCCRYLFDLQVVRFIEEGILLSRPSMCSVTIYHIMLGCWRRDPVERFSFERIHRHLTDYEQHRRPLP